MQINVNIYARLRYYLPDPEKYFREKEWSMPEGSTVSDVLKELKLPEEVRIMVLLNNNTVDQKAVLKEGDIVHILPQTVGG
jgi:sulfur carrier protein ThiS